MTPAPQGGELCPTGIQAVHGLVARYWERSIKGAHRRMRRILPVLLIALSGLRAQAQVAVCGTPGFNGPANVAQTINTYYPPNGDVSIDAGSTSLSLGAVPATDAYGNTFGSDAIAAGDLLLIIQVQDVDINTSNGDLYGANNVAVGPDALGGTGFTAINNTGRYEYPVATNNVSLPGGTLTFNVDPVNDPPIALNDTVATDEDVSIIISLLGNDTDLADGALGGLDSLSVSIAVPPAHGTVGTSVDGSIGYTSAQDFKGLHPLRYQVCDPGYPLPAEYGTAWVIIALGDVNDPPVITDQVGAPIDTLNVSTPEDVPVQICFNAIDPEGDTLDAANSFNGPDFGIISGEADGDTCITCTPDPEYNGGDTVTVVICDNGGLCDTVVVVIDVAPVNDPPQVVDVIGDPTDTVTTTTPEGTPITICFDAIDIDGDAVEVSGVISGPQNGTATGLADGDTCWTYTPDPDYHGTDTVTVLVCDNNGGCDTVLVIIDVAPVNDDPIITDGTGSPADALHAYTLEDIPLTVCLDGTDVDGDSLDVSSVPYGPFSGSVTGLQDGDTCFTYAPDPGFLGNDTLLAVVDDGHGGTDTVVVIITVLETNDPPIIVDGSGTPIDTVEITTFEDTPIQLCLDAIDPEGLPVEITSFTPIDISGAILGLGDGDTCITYSPYPNTSGTDTLYVFVCDGFGACDSVLLIIHIIPVDDPPVITDPSFVPIDTLYVTTETGTPLGICLDALDPDGDALDVTAILNGPLNGVAASFNDGDTCFTYIPDPGFLGGDTLTAVVCDPSGACDTVLVIIEVTSPNIPPIIVDGSFADADTLDFTTAEDTPITICLTAIDFDGDTLDVTGIFGGPLNGFVNGIADGDTCFTYTPVPDWNGTDTFSAIVCDDNGGCDTVLIIIHVTPVNDPPAITDPGFVSIDTLITTTEVNTPLVICLEALDIDGDTLDVTTILNGPLNGAADSFNDGDTCFTYTPDPGFIGIDTLTAVVCDNAGACDTVLVIIDVTSPNNPPIIVDGSFADADTLDFTTAEDTPITICLTAIDFDGDTLDVTGIFDGPSNGSANGIADGDTCFTYAPVPDWNGTDTLSAVVCDDNGGCDTVLVIIVVTPVNDPPIVVDGGIPADTLNTTTPEGIPVTICVDADDTDGDTLDVTAVIDDAENGSTSGIADGDTCFTYTPDPGFIGTDTVTVAICDNTGACDTVTVIIDVTPLNPNDPPIAVDDTANTAVGTAVSVSILDNDSDPDGDPLTVSSTSALHGTVVINGDGTITYTPDSGFCGTDTITYTVCDPFLACDDAIVLVDVPCPPVNDPPIAVDDNTSTTINTSVTVNVLGNDSDPNGDQITVTTASASHGTVTINGDGTINYTPDPLFCGTDTVFYTICDPGPLCDEAIVAVEIPCPPANDPPIAVDDTATADAGADISLPIDVLGNDSDPDGDPLTVTNATAGHGIVIIGPSGELFYMPQNGFCGMDTITYTVCDPEPLCDEAFVFVTVECPDTAELAIPEGFSPNNDGYGDRWIIRGLEKYPLAKVTIFNRWGNEVYSADPYGNDWDGRGTNGLTWDGVLPTATYWYLLDLGAEGEEVRTGYIYLNR